MAPALLLLNANAASFGIREPLHFFWATGLLSSFLDNAPTYLTFAATAAGLAGVELEGRYLATFLETGPEAGHVLAAISCGAVFMGANTYIGNGPNFMVKAIAEERGVSMPSFFGYMLYSTAVLIPLFAVVSWMLL
jgi:Na+/H+ antiporter NhaD/arsenite permease-like protein